jgi:predicted O-methyltransferase YrrM
MISEIEMFNDPDAPVQTNQYANEFSVLLEMYRQRQPRRVLEIGVHRGGSLYQWIKHAQPWTTIVAVDLPGGLGGEEGSADDVRWHAWARAHDVELKVFLGDSHDIDVMVSVGIWAPFEWIFIDGDHSYKGVIADWLDYGNMIAPGCPVIFHDILPHPRMEWVEVHRFWEELKAEGGKKGWEMKELVSGMGQEMRGIGIIYGQADHG